MQRFGAEVEAFAKAARLDARSSGTGDDEVEGPSQEAIDALRAVGYIE